MIARTPRRTPPAAPVASMATPARQPAAPARRARRFYRVAKRLLDLAVALTVLALLAPLYALLAVIVVLDSGRPILYRREVVGLHGRTFRMYKFRTMTVNAEQLLLLDPDLLHAYTAQNFKLKRDPRVTPAGRFLRKFSLDELPQLWNVVRGEMSLVGPRWIPSHEIEQLGELAALRHSVPPGITGLWQVSGRSNTTWAERMRLDKEYVERCSLWLDLWILLRTPFAILRADGAY
ncbi:MAG TPA: sugar transferase [Ktedonobacterales bacterium]|nr:sugar transferase [Ktedonobacterales bacterium]